MSRLRHPLVRAVERAGSIEALRLIVIGVGCTEVSLTFFLSPVLY